VVRGAHPTTYLTTVTIDCCYMSLLDLWNKSPEQLKDKQVQQLVAIAGNGKLTDGGSCSIELRDLLAIVPSRSLEEYAEQCLAQSFTDSGLVLQDIINEVGTRLGATSKRGRYRGTTKDIGFDGLWSFPSGHSIIVEVKTTDAYRIDLNKIAEYRRKLISSSSITEDSSSMLIVVGRQDTGDLEAQIRGSRFAWDIRIISVVALFRLLAIKEEVDDPAIVQRIHNILIPREFTRLDAIADILFTAAEEIKQEQESEAIEVDDDTVQISPKGQKFKPVAFHEECVQIVQSKLGISLVKRSRSGFSSPDKSVALTCSVSKEYKPETRYWFAFHPHQRNFLREHSKAYVVFGCGSSNQVMVIPFTEFENWLEGTGTTVKNENMYWHIVILHKDNKYTFRRKKGERSIDLTQYVLPTA
jgi:hypothetical protein